MELASTLPRGLAINRIAFGLGYIVAPERTGSSWIGKPAKKRGTTVLTRALTPCRKAASRFALVMAGASTAIALLGASFRGLSGGPRSAAADRCYPWRGVGEVPPNRR